MNILITGIHGFVGRNLIYALREKSNIYGLDIITQQVDGVITTYTWDEFDQIQDIDIIIHLAAIAHDVKNKAGAKILFDVNTGLTRKIYDWFLASDAKKFIFFSTVKAAADKVVGDILTEDVIPSPKGPYGESKIKAEEYIQSKWTVDSGQWTARRDDKDNCQLSTINCQLKRTYILRPCMIHGPGNKGNLNLLYKVVMKGIPYPLGAFENRRSFCSVDNLSFVISELIEKEIPGGIYNVADDECLSTNELIALMATTTGKPIRIWKWNKGLIQWAARVGTVLHLPLNTERLQKLTENYVVSNAKIKRALGIEQMPFRAEEGLKKTVSSF